MYLVYEYHTNEIPEGLEPLRSVERVKLDLVKYSPPAGHLSTARTTLSTVYCDTHSQRTQIEGF